MPFQKGHTLSKGKGRGTNEKVLEDYKEKVKELTIEELATDKVYKQLTTLKGRDKTDRQGVKEIALPVYLKSKADIKELKGKLSIEQITGMDIKKDNNED